jgi:hypothetical protein
MEDLSVYLWWELIFKYMIHDTLSNVVKYCVDEKFCDIGQCNNEFQAELTKPILQLHRLIVIHGD